jgi:hypothetical protein
VGLGRWAFETFAKRWTNRARKGKEGPEMKSLLQFLDGNNRIIALALLLLVGAINALFGVDLANSVNFALMLLGFDASWLRELGIDKGPAEITFAAYAFFSITRALYKRANGLPERPKPQDLVDIASRRDFHSGLGLAFLALSIAAPAAAQTNPARVEDQVWLERGRAFEEPPAIVGTIRFELRGPDGRLKEVRELHNLVVDAGKAGIASRINGSGGEAAFAWIGIGIGTTSPAAGNTALETERDETGASNTNHKSCTTSRVTTDVTNDTAQCVASFSFSATLAITESGYFNATPAGTMASRATFSAINVVSGDSLSVTWKLDVD